MKIKGKEIKENSMLRIEDPDGVVSIGFIHSIEVLKKKLDLSGTDFKSVICLLPIDITTSKDISTYPDDMILFCDADIKDFFLLDVVDDGFTEAQRTEESYGEF